MTVCVTDEDGAPVDAGLESELYLPDGSTIDLEWTHVSAGGYVTTYVPQQEGAYFIEVGVKEDINCYLEEAFDVFYVRDCIQAVVDLEIGDTFLDEPVTFVLTFTDGSGNVIPGGEVKPVLYLPDGSAVSITWIDQGDGTYTAQYTPSSMGIHQVKGVVITVDGAVCYVAYFCESFEVTWKQWPDLVIRNEDITIEPEPELEDTVLISVTVWNFGAVDAENFWVVILINDEVVYKEFIDILPAGESITIEYWWFVPYTGGYIIQAIADPPEEMV